MEGSQGEVTLLLKAAGQGDAAAMARVYDLMYGELRRLARSCMSHERPDHSLQPTALIHEVYLRLGSAQGIQWQSRSHFAAIAATAMRRILVDHARSHAAEIHGGNRARVTFDDATAPAILGDPSHLIAVHEALNALARTRPRQARIVELRFFGGLTIEEIAAVFDVAPRTIRRDWSLARIWLHKRLKSDAGNSSSPGNTLT